MGKIAYFDCPTGIAGDMCLGALVDLGVPLEYLIRQLKRLDIEEEYQLRAAKVKKNGQLATKVKVDLSPAQSQHYHHRARHLPEITAMIQQAGLPPQVEQWSLAIFSTLAQAEGSVHGVSPEKVHFHEVGATDALVDIVGTCLGLDWLGIKQIYCSALPTGDGTVNTAHGRLPVPVPAVIKLWEMRQVPVYSNNIDRELVTPTGAAIITTLAQKFSTIPPLVLEKIGLGAGDADLPLPNILRLWLGEAQPVVPREKIALLETQIDDSTPQIIAYTLERLMQAGALDVFTQAITMKKSRQAILLTVICPLDKIHICESIIFQETTTLGIRKSLQERSVLAREIRQVTTPWGIARVKIAFSTIAGEKSIINAQPEYEDCAAIAQKANRSLLEIQTLVKQSCKLDREDC